jgi:hypothetical protein
MWDQGLKWEIKNSSFQDAEGLAAPIHLVTHRVAAILATVFIFFPVGQDQEQKLSNRNGLPAVCTV